MRESGGTIYVNFGRRWSEDFTATLLRRNEKTSRNIRLRGVIEDRGGPWIELNRPEQIEIVGND